MGVYSSGSRVGVEPSVRHRSGGIAALHSGALGIHAHDGSFPQFSACDQRNSVAEKEFHLAGYAVQAGRLAFERVGLRCCAQAANDIESGHPRLGDR